MQEPKWVIAFGSCPINGGIYYDSYSVINRLALYLPVDLSIEGCMPRPEAIIDGFTKLMKAIEKGEAVGYKNIKKIMSGIRKIKEKFLKEQLQF